MFTNIDDILEIDEKELDSNSNSIVSSDMNKEPKIFSNEEHSEEERERVCKDCGKVFPLFDEQGNVSYEYFQKNTSANTGGAKYWRTDCRECRKNSGKGREIAKKRYAMEHGISIKEVKSPYTSCQLTGREQTSIKKPIVFDHCNITQRFRGWLHDSTNRAMGMLKWQGSDVKGLVRAANYCNTTEGFSFSINDKGEIEVNEK